MASIGVVGIEAVKEKYGSVLTIKLKTYSWKKRKAIRIPVVKSALNLLTNWYYWLCKIKIESRDRNAPKISTLSRFTQNWHIVLFYWNCVIDTEQHNLYYDTKLHFTVCMYEFFITLTLCGVTIHYNKLNVPLLFMSSSKIICRKQFQNGIIEL